MKDTGKEFKGVPIFTDSEVPPNQILLLNNLPPRRYATISPIDVDPENVGFKDIHYKGKPVTRDADARTAELYYNHIYRPYWSGMKRMELTAGRHMCLNYGNWCWLQAREHPMEAVKFLLNRRLPR